MKIPKRLKPLVEDGLIDEVIRPLMSGKEADVFIVRCGSEIRCAKVYKEADKRSFKQATQYQEGRKVRNSRRARAMEKSSRYGRREQEQAWQNTEVDALYRLARVGVRVPKPYGCFDGVLLMELICDDQGFEAPRLNDVAMTSTQAVEDHQLMIRYVVRMLCEGLVHGDLSEFNVLVDDYGPVIIDLPQVVNAAANNHAERLFARDVNKITSYYGLFSPEILNTRYAEEIWALYEAGELHSEVELSGEYTTVEVDADVDAVLEEIKQAMLEEEQRLARLAEAS
ncbi:MAG: serine protein kinase RIO [Gammaproteobacteria bacterium]|nr:MAG: serine protein kinase RIO [Gammaproteobacteria bacterium]